MENAEDEEGITIKDIEEFLVQFMTILDPSIVKHLLNSYG